MFPREFVEWLTANTIREMHGKFCIAPIKLSETTQYYTIDELYKYWRLEIEPKIKEDEKETD